MGNAYDPMQALQDAADAAYANDMGALKMALTARTEERDIAICMLAAWCLAVEEDASWDGWDEHYKDAKFRPTPIRELIDKELAAQRGENAV